MHSKKDFRIVQKNLNWMASHQNLCKIYRTILPFANLFLYRVQGHFEKQSFHVSMSNLNPITQVQKVEKFWSFETKSNSTCNPQFVFFSSLCIRLTKKENPWIQFYWMSNEWIVIFRQKSFHSLFYKSGRKEKGLI